MNSQRPVMNDGQGPHTEGSCGAGVAIKVDPTQDWLLDFAAVCRSTLEGMEPDERDDDFLTFPHGACGATANLLAQVLFELWGIRSEIVLGQEHAHLRRSQSHAWLEVSGLTVDITHDQFAGTGLKGWVFAPSLWHASFGSVRREPLCSEWWSFPVRAHAALSSAFGCVQNVEMLPVFKSL